MYRRIHNMRIPQRRENRCHNRFTYFTSQSVWSPARFPHHLRQRLEFLNFDNIVQVGSSICEMRTKVVTYLVSSSFHFCVENGLNERHTSSTSCSCFCLCF